MRFLISLLFSITITVHATEEYPEPPITKGGMVRVLAWDQKSKTYDIEMPLYPAQGPNYATTDDLAKAVNTLDAAKLKANPGMVVGNEYHLDEDLQLQPVGKIDAIRAAGKPRKPAKPAKRKSGK